MKTKLEKLKRLFSLYKIKTKIERKKEVFEFVAEKKDGLIFASINEINNNKIINAISYDMTLLEYLELGSFELAYTSFKQNDAKELLNKYIVTLNKNERKLLEKMVRI